MRIINDNQHYLAVSVDELDGLRELAEQVIRATGGWSATAQDKSGRKKLVGRLLEETETLDRALDEMNNLLLAIGMGTGVMGIKGVVESHEAMRLRVQELTIQTEEDAGLINDFKELAAKAESRATNLRALLTQTEAQLRAAKANALTSRQTRELARLEALEIAGVRDWDGYDDALCNVILSGSSEDEDEDEYDHYD